MSISVKSQSPWAGGSLPTRSVKRSRSRVRTWETLATESFGSPVTRAESMTFPGASAQRRLLVRGTHKTVEIRLRFKASPCTTTTGRRNPGADPTGAGRSAHQTSPWEITIRFALKCDGRPLQRTHLGDSPIRHRLDPWHRLHPPARGASRTP